MKLVDQYGTPFRISDLDAPQTSRIALLQNLYIDSHMEGISPARASRILREADEGNLTAQHALFDDMLDRDAHLACEFGKRQTALLTLDWAITAPQDATPAEQKAAAWAEGILRDAVDDFEDVITAMMGAVGHGFAPIEIEWQRWGGEYLPRFHPRPQSWFQLDPTRRELRLINGTGEGETINPMGWIFHTAGKVKTGYLSRLGICRCLIWPFIYKHYAVGDFAEFLETYGLPIITGKYGAEAKPAEKASLMRSVTALGHNARAIMPQDMEIEIHKITGSGDGDVHLKMVDWAERSQSKAILGQTLSSEASATGMGSGVADLHGEVRNDILKSDARRVAATLTRDLVYPLLALNGKGADALRRCPRFEFDIGESEDLKNFAETLPKLAASGARIPVSWVHEKLRIPLAEDGEEIMTAGAPAAAPPPEAALAALKASPATRVAHTPDPAEQTAPRLIRDTAGDLQRWLDTIEVMMNAAGSMEEFQTMLLAAYPKLDDTRLIETLSTAFTALDLAGRADVEADQ
jgi:phage gp29-like protein